MSVLVRYRVRITTRATQSAYVKRGVARQHGDWICTLFRDRIPHRQIRWGWIGDGTREPSRIPWTYFSCLNAANS